MTHHTLDVAGQILKLKMRNDELRQDRDRLKNECIEYVVTIRELEEEVKQLKIGLAIAEGRL